MAIWSAILTSFLAAFLASVKMMQNGAKRELKEVIQLSISISIDAVPVGFCAMKASVIGALDTGLGRGSCSTEVISELKLKQNKGSITKPR